MRVSDACGGTWWREGQEVAATLAALSDSAPCLRDLVDNETQRTPGGGGEQKDGEGG